MATRPPDNQPPPGPAGPRGPDGRPDDTPLWRSRRLWHPIGYAFTGIWMVAVLAATGGSSRHPFFDYIFVVPLAVWILGLVAGALIKRRFSR